MKNSRKHILTSGLAAAALMLTGSMASCSDDEVMNNLPATGEPEGEALTRVTAEVPGFPWSGGSDGGSAEEGGTSGIGALTRTDYQITDAEVTPVWVENDTIGIFPNTGAQAYFVIPTTETTGNQANFDGGGWALRPAATYAAYYPYDFYNRDLKAIAVSYEGQRQKGNATTAHLGAYDFMAATATAPTDGKANMEFAHLGGLARVTLTVPTAGTTIGRVAVKLSSSSFAKEATFDLTATSIALTPTTTTDVLTADVEGITTTADNEQVTLYMMLPPVAEIEGRTLTVYVGGGDAVFSQQLAMDRIAAGEAHALALTADGMTTTSSTVNVETAGGLETALGEAGQYLTELTVTGNLDYNDVRTMINYGYPKINLKGATFSDDYTFSLAFYGNNTVKEIVLPDALTSLGVQAFGHCSSLSSVTLGSGLQTIENYAFYCCPSLSSVTIPESVTTIGTQAFQDCSSLTDITLGSGLQTIGPQAFQGTSLSNITIPESVTSIEDCVFQMCSSLSSITIPENVTSIGDYTFGWCSSLSSVTLQGTVQKTLGSNCFVSCSSALKIYVDSSLLESYKADYSEYADNFAAIPVEEEVTE